MDRTDIVSAIIYLFIAFVLNYSIHQCRHLSFGCVRRKCIRTRTVSNDRAICVQSFRISECDCESSKYASRKHAQIFFSATIRQHCRALSCSEKLSRVVISLFIYRIVFEHVAYYFFLRFVAKNVFNGHTDANIDTHTHDVCIYSCECGFSPSHVAVVHHTLICCLYKVGSSEYLCGDTESLKYVCFVCLQLFYCFFFVLHDTEFCGATRKEVAVECEAVGGGVEKCSITKTPSF